MDVFEIVPAYDERTHVPFRVPRKGEEPIEFTLPRLQYLTEDQATAMKVDLQALDRFVPQLDVNGEEMFQFTREGDIALDEEGERKILMGPPQRTVAEKSRAVAQTMLKVVVEADVYERLCTLTVGELDQILAHWTKVSERPLEGLTLGESSASSTS